MGIVHSILPRGYENRERARETVGLSSEVATSGHGVYHVLEEDETASRCGNLDDTNPFTSNIHTVLDREEAEAFGYTLCGACRRRGE